MSTLSNLEELSAQVQNLGLQIAALQAERSLETNSTPQQLKTSQKSSTRRHVLGKLALGMLGAGAAVAATGFAPPAANAMVMVGVNPGAILYTLGCAISGAPPAGFKYGGIGTSDPAFNRATLPTVNIGLYGTASNMTGLNQDNVGVYGYSRDGIGVQGVNMSDKNAAIVAENQVGPTGAALEIRKGKFRVLNAGINTPTVSYIHMVSVATTVPYTQLNHPVLNSNPRAIIFITINHGPITTSPPPPPYNHVAGVFYFQGFWYIYNEDGALMPANTAFNVFITTPF